MIKRAPYSLGFSLLVVIFAALPGLSADDESLSLERQVAERSAPIVHEVDFSAVVTPPYGCKVLKVWLPLPPSDAGQEVTTHHCASFPMDVEPAIHTEPVFGNRFAYFEFHEPKGAQIVRHQFTAKVWQLDWRMDPRRVKTPAEWPQEFAAYLKRPGIAEQRAFVDVLDTFKREGQQPAGDLLSAMRWVDANMTYDHASASLTADPEWAFRERRGHCSDYHGLCAAMGRALGYPSRITYGLSLVPKNSPSHCKLDVYLPPYGWISFDLSETQKLLRFIEKNKSLDDARRAALDRAVRRRLFSGFRENSWLLVTRGSQYELAPPASGPVGVVRTIYAEADGKPLPEPDPANPEQREFSWMTVHKYTSDKPFRLPFQNLETLAPYLAGDETQSD